MLMLLLLLMLLLQLLHTHIIVPFTAPASLLAPAAFLDSRSEGETLTHW